MLFVTLKPYRTTSKNRPVALAPCPNIWKAAHLAIREEPVFAEYLLLQLGFGTSRAPLGLGNYRLSDWR